MKRTSPMKMRLGGSIKTQLGRKGAPMERYAAERNKALKAKAAPTPSIGIIHETMRELHDPKYDMDTLMRAAEVKADKARHKAAKGEASQRITRLQGLVKEG